MDLSYFYFFPNRFTSRWVLVTPRGSRGEEGVLITTFLPAPAPTPRYVHPKIQICVTAAFWATDAFLSSRSNFWRSQGLAPAPTDGSHSVRKYAPAPETEDFSTL